MKNKRNSAPLVLIGIVFLATVLLRGLNIFHAVIVSDVAYPDALVKAVGIVHDACMLAVYGVSLSLIVYCGWNISFKSALKASGCFTAIVFADRLFCFCYDLVTSNIAWRDKNTVATALTWLGIDFAYFAVTYFAAAFISGRAKAKSLSGKKKKNFYSSLVASALVLTALRLVSQIAVCVRFVLEFGSPTATEYAQMAGDILLVIFKYGVLVFAFSFAGYLILDKKMRLDGKINENN